MGRRKSTELGTPVSIRISDELQSQLDTAAVRLGIPMHEVMRFACRVGIEHFKRIGYDVPSAVLNAPSQSPIVGKFVHSLNQPSPMPADTELVEIKLTNDEAEILELAKRKGTLARKLSKAAARLPKPGKLGATSAS